MTSLIAYTSLVILAFDFISSELLTALPTSQKNIWCDCGGAKEMAARYTTVFRTASDTGSQESKVCTRNWTNETNVAPKWSLAYLVLLLRSSIGAFWEDFLSGIRHPELSKNCTQLKENIDFWKQYPLWSRYFYLHSIQLIPFLTINFICSFVSIYSKAFVISRAH